MNTNVIIRLSGSAKVHVLVDGCAIAFDAEGAASMLLEPGEHSLLWAACGTGGSAYSIAVEEAKTARMRHEAVLDESEKDAGLHWISV